MTLKERIIADRWGYEHQSRQLIEEMAELTQAINKAWRYSEARYYADIVEEIADVEICLEQVKYLLEVESDELNRVKEYKIDRELERLHCESEVEE